MTSVSTVSIEENLTMDVNSVISIDTNEENSEVSEIQLYTMENNLSINTPNEQPDLCETSITNEPSEFHSNVVVYVSFPRLIETPNTTDNITSNSELKNSSVTDTQDDSHNTMSSITSNTLELSIAETPPIPIVTKIKEEKQFSVVNCCSIPPGTIISHMSCSSTYIYICTNQQELFYAKIPQKHLNIPLHWERYFQRAEQLIVSTSNQTIWRILNKCVYSSSDTIKLSPLGIHWTELKFSKGQSLLSISINDQYGWYVEPKNNNI
jgi:hypothetical protein